MARDSECKMRYHPDEEPDAWVTVRPRDPGWWSVCAQPGVQYWDVDRQQWVALDEGMK